MRVSHIFLLVSLISPAGFFACSSDASLGSDRSAINKSGTGDPAGDEAKDEPTQSSGGSPFTPTPNPGDKDPPKDADGGASPLPDPTTDRPSYTNAECTAKGGEAIGDIGDGAIHRPDYVCANGEPPIGMILSEAGGPIGVEGSVCCGSDGAEKQTYSNAECKAAGGEVTGDPGDGSTHRPDYLCANGEPPLGEIMPGKGEPIAIEGAVCCGAEKATYTFAECKAAGGVETYDIGDGSTHRPDYLCANGEPPLATIVPGSGEPRPREGAVCCGPEETTKTTYSFAECKAAGGVETYDIGDGAIHRPGYVCANGKPPLGTIMPADGEPLPIEGAVCCGADPVDSCKEIQCLRAIECVASCGGPVLQAGCCACPEGSFDSIACDNIDIDLLNSACDEKGSCPAGLTPTKYFGIAGPSGPEFCSCVIPCDKSPKVCPAMTSCVTIADGPGTVCSKQ